MIRQIVDFDDSGFTVYVWFRKPGLDRIYMVLDWSPLMARVSIAQHLDGDLNLNLRTLWFYDFIEGESIVKLALFRQENTPVQRLSDLFEACKCPEKYFDVFSV